MASVYLWSGLPLKNMSQKNRKPGMQTGKGTKNKIISPSNRSEFEFGSDKISMWPMVSCASRAGWYLVENVFIEMVYHLCAKFERLQGTKKTVGIVVGVAGDICKSDRSLMVTWMTLSGKYPHFVRYFIPFASHLLSCPVSSTTAVRNLKPSMLRLGWLHFPLSLVPSYISSQSADVILSDVRPFKLKLEALHIINVFLDEFLYSLLNSSASLSTDKLRGSLLSLLPTSLGKEALLEAEVELRAYWERTANERGPSGELDDDSETFHLSWAYEVSFCKSSSMSSLILNSTSCYVWNARPIRRLMNPTRTLLSKIVSRSGFPRLLLFLQAPPSCPQQHYI